MATSLVDELIQLASDEGTPLTELLRLTKVLASTLRITELQEWVKNETNGYSGGIDQLPEYRRIRCELRYQSRYGWNPIVLPSELDGEIAEYFTTAYLYQAAAELEAIVASGTGELLQRLPDKEHRMLAELYPPLQATQAGRMYGRASVRGVLDTIRGRVLDAALELKEKGIRGDGMSFSDEEKGKAAEAATHIITNIYGDHASIASAVNSPHAGVASATGSATISQHITTIQQSNQQLAEAFKSILEALRADATLDAAKRAETEQQLQFLAEQAAKPKQQRQPLAVLKSVFLGIAQAVSLSANVAKAWDAYGPVISGFFGS